MNHSVTPRELLHALLCSLFASGEQFQRWVALGPDGDRLVVEFLGGSASTAAVVFGGLDVLSRHKYVDTVFFVRLAAEFPRRSDEIRRVAAAWGVTLDRGAPRSAVTTAPQIAALACDPTLGQHLQATLRRGLSGLSATVTALPSEALTSATPPALAPASYLVYLRSPGASGLPTGWGPTFTQQEIVVVVAGLDEPVAGDDPLHIHLSTADINDDLDPLLVFFRKELAENPRPASRSDLQLLRGVSRRVLRLVARHCIDDVTLDGFLFDAEIERGRIRGASLHERLVDLLHLADSEGLLVHFGEFLEEERGRCVRTQLERLRNG